MARRRGCRAAVVNGRFRGCDTRMVLQFVQVLIVDGFADAVAADLQEMQRTAQMDWRPNPQLGGFVDNLAANLMEFFVFRQFFAGSLDGCRRGGRDWRRLFQCRSVRIRCRCGCGSGSSFSLGFLGANICACGDLRDDLQRLPNRPFGRLIQRIVEVAFEMMRMHLMGVRHAEHGHFVRPNRTQPIVADVRTECGHVRREDLQANMR